MFVPNSCFDPSGQGYNVQLCMGTLSRFSVLAGLACVVFSLGMGTALLWHYLTAARLDAKSESLGAAPCMFPLKGFETPRVLSTGESKPATLLLFNDGTSVCTVHLTLAAPDFELGAPGTRSLELLPGQRATASWILSPKSAGRYTISLSTDYHSVTRGIVVTSVFGFSVSAAGIASIAASFLGPMLTLPWWIERWEKRKQPGKTMEETA
jgi:hypothetical protein